MCNQIEAVGIARGGVLAGLIVMLDTSCVGTDKGIRMCSAEMARVSGRKVDVGLA